MKTAINPATIDKAIDQFKAQLLKEVLTDAPTLTTCYDNWFLSQINHEKDVLRVAQGESAKADTNISAPVEAWTRARELFLTLAAPALHELAATVAQQIEIEFVAHSIASSDVADSLRNTPLSEILHHMN